MKNERKPEAPEESADGNLSGPRAGTVMGWHLPGERLTAAGWAVLAAVFALPVLVVGLALDALVQWAFGWCLGVWCWF